MKLKNNRGFTGVDIAVSTVILIVFVSLIITMFFNVSVTAKKIERKTIATNLAIQAIEAMKIINFENLTETMTISDINYFIENKIEIPNGYEIEVGVDNSKYPDVIKIISAQVNYQNTKKLENVKIETLVKSTAIIDTIKPNTKITVLKNDMYLGEKMTYIVELSDNESGINLSECKWVITNSNTELGTNPDEYTGGHFNSITETIEITSQKYGIYYLHILAKDNAGNVKETISEKLRVRERLYLYNYGDENTEITGGYSFVCQNTGYQNTDIYGIKYQKYSDHFYAYARGESTYGPIGVYCSENKIDFTTWEKLTWNYKILQKNDKGLEKLLIENTRNQVTADGEYSFTDMGEIGNNNKEIDISEINGKYYIAVGVGGPWNNFIEIEVYQIYIER